MRRGLLAISLLLALGLLLAGCGGGGGDEEASAPETTVAATEVTVGEETGCRRVEAPPAQPEGTGSAPAQILDASKTYRLVVDTTCGSFTIELDLESAPQTTASLVALARAGFFDGTTFHRVVPGFVIQGGDPTGTGTGGPGYQTVDAPAPEQTYTRGVVAMAKTAAEAPGTSGSQFFVVTGDDIGLPPEYAVVGRVVEGMENVLLIDALGAGDGPPSQPVVIEKVRVEES